MSTGGQSLPGGQAALVTPSGTVVGSAQVPISSSKYYGGSGRALSRVEQEFERQEALRKEQERLRKAAEESARLRRERAEKVAAQREAERAERQSRGVRQYETDEFTRLQRRAGESDESFSARKNKVITSAEITRKQSLVRPEQLNALDSGKETPQSQSAVVEIPANTVSVAPTKYEQYKQAIKDKGFFRGTLFFAGEKTQGQLSRLEDKYTPRGQSFSSTGVPSAVVQTAPYFAGGGVGGALLFASSGEELVFGQKRIIARGQALSEKTSVPKPVGVGASYALELGGLGLGTYQITRPLTTPKTNIIDVQTRTARVPETTLIKVSEGRVVRVPAGSTVVRSTVLSETQQGLFNPSRVRQAARTTSLVTKEGKTIRVQSTSKTTARRTFGQKNTIAEGYLSGKPKTSTSTSKGEFTKWYDFGNRKEFVGSVRNAQQGGVSSFKLSGTDAVVLSKTRPLVETGFGKTLRGVQGETRGVITTKERLNAALRSTTVPRPTPQQAPRTPRKPLVLSTRANQQVLSVQEARAASISTTPTPQPRSSTVRARPVRITTQQQAETPQVTVLSDVSTPRTTTITKVRGLLASGGRTRTKTKQKARSESATLGTASARTDLLRSTQAQGQLSRSRSRSRQKQQSRAVQQARAFLQMNRARPKPLVPPVVTNNNEGGSVGRGSSAGFGEYDILYGVGKRKREKFMGSLEQAFSKALTETRGRITAGFAITRRGSSTPLPLPTSLPADIRPSKTTKGFAVQKKRLRLSTKGEVKDIFAARRTRRGSLF